MSARRHILFLNEFFHPDICASAAVLTDRLPLLTEMRPDWRITVIAGNRSWDDPAVIYPAADEYRGVRIVRVNRPAVWDRLIAGPAQAISLCHTGRANIIRRALGFAAFARGAGRAARALDRVDLVVATTAPPHGAHLARKIARRHRCPYVYTVLDLYPDLAVTLGRLRARGLVHRLWLARDTKVMREAAAVVSIAQRTTGRIAATRSVPHERLRTIHDGMDAMRVAGPGPDNEFQARLNPGGKFVVQYAGNMGLSHPFDTILTAARAFAGEPDILFQFIGDGPQRPYVEAHLPPNAQLLDYQPAARLGQVLAAADVCLISQHGEMFDQALPYKIYATLAAAKPCIFIGDRQSEIAEWLRQAGAGWQVNCGDSQALVSRIRELKADQTGGNEMGRAARAFFDARFHARRTAAQWAELIETLLN
jgi:glycosyltransferase involved in cell wall biosynthesis